MKRIYWGRTGTNLVELILATALVVTVIVSFGLLVPKATKAMANHRSHLSATAMASSQMQTIQSEPYLMTPLTPAIYFDASAPNCDCNRVDFSAATWPNQTPLTQTEVNGGTSFTKHVCVNLSTQTAPGVWASTCPLPAPPLAPINDAGLRNIVVQVTWGTGDDLKVTKLAGTVSSNEQGSATAAATVSVQVKVCHADDSTPTNCDYSKSDTTGAQISLSQASFVASQPAAAPGTPVTLTVVPGNGYTFHVQKFGFFPFTAQGLSFPATSNPIPLQEVILRSTITYSSKLIGEVYVATHPVISTVVNEVSYGMGCTTAGAFPNYTEALEIYNPTSSQLFAGCSGANCIKLQFCSNTNCDPHLYNLTEPIFSPGGQTTIDPGHYFLLEGLDTANGRSYIGFGTPIADKHYDLAVAPLNLDNSDGLITRHGGGIKVYVVDPLTGLDKLADSVHWDGLQDPSAGQTPITSFAPEDYTGPWEGKAPSEVLHGSLVSTSLAGKISCTCDTDCVQSNAGSCCSAGHCTGGAGGPTGCTLSCASCFATPRPPGCACGTDSDCNAVTFPGLHCNSTTHACSTTGTGVGNPTPSGPDTSYGSTPSYSNPDESVDESVDESGSPDESVDET